MTSGRFSPDVAISMSSHMSVCYFDLSTRRAHGLYSTCREVTKILIIVVPVSVPNSELFDFAKLEVPSLQAAPE